MTEPQRADEEMMIENVTIRNWGSKPLHILFEPWLDEYDLALGTSIVISSRGPVGGGIELVYKDTELVVWGWVGCKLAVLQDNKLIIDNRDFPPIPPGPPTLQALGDWVWHDYVDKPWSKRTPPA